MVGSKMPAGTAIFYECTYMPHNAPISNREPDNSPITKFHLTLFYRDAVTAMGIGIVRVGVRVKDQGQCSEIRLEFKLR